MKDATGKPLCEGDLVAYTPNVRYGTKLRVCVVAQIGGEDSQACHRDAFVKLILAEDGYIKTVRSEREGTPPCYEVQRWLKRKRKSGFTTRTIRNNPGPRMLVLMRVEEQQGRPAEELIEEAYNI